MCRSGPRACLLRPRLLILRARLLYLVVVVVVVVVLLLRRLLLIARVEPVHTDGLLQSARLSAARARLRWKNLWRWHVGQPRAHLFAERVPLHAIDRQQVGAEDQHAHERRNGSNGRILHRPGPLLAARGWFRLV